MKSSSQDKIFTNEEVFNMLIEFAIAYNKSTNKDIVNDASEFLNDKINEK